MNLPVSSSSNGKSYTLFLKVGLILVLVFAVTFGGYKFVFSSSSSSGEQTTEQEVKPAAVPAPVLSDSEEYDNKIIQMVNGDSSGKWPVKTDYPLAGAILPFKRIVAYYGNLYSKQMGILGE